MHTQIFTYFSFIGLPISKWFQVDERYLNVKNNNSDFRKVELIRKSSSGSGDRTTYKVILVTGLDSLSSEESL